MRFALLALALLLVSACDSPPEGVRLYAGGDSAAVRTNGAAVMREGRATLVAVPPLGGQSRWLEANGFGAGAFVTDAHVPDTLAAVSMRVFLPGELRYGR